MEVNKSIAIFFKLTMENEDVNRTSTFKDDALAAAQDVKWTSMLGLTANDVCLI